MSGRQFIAAVTARIYSRLFLAAGVSLAIVVAAAFLWRPVGALACDDFGSLALARHDGARALEWFDRGLTLAPHSRALLEDRGLARLASDPSRALADFRAADCGAPCRQDAGDAHVLLGDIDAAIEDYIAARSVTRLNDVISRLTAAGRLDDAIHAELAMAAQFSDSPLDRADLARSLWQIGRLEELLAAYKRPGLATRYRAEAIRVLSRAAAIAPFNEGYLLELGHAQMQWGDRRAARHTFERLLELHPHQTDAERALQRLDAAPPKFSTP